jgi:hypothetical protein
VIRCVVTTWWCPLLRVETCLGKRNIKTGRRRLLSMSWSQYNNGWNFEESITQIKKLKFTRNNYEFREWGFECHPKIKATECNRIVTLWVQFLSLFLLSSYAQILNMCISPYSPSTCLTEHISKVTKSTIERRLLSSEGINNHKLLQFLLLTDKLLNFLLLTVSFYLHPRMITFSTLKQCRKSGNIIYRDQTGNRVRAITRFGRRGRDE